MKRIIVSILVVFTIVSCRGSTEEFLLRQTLSNRTTVSGVTGFEKCGTITLADEVDEQLKIYNSKITWDRSFYDAFRENVEDSVKVNLPDSYIYHKYSFYKLMIKKDEEIITYLEDIDDIYTDIYNQVSFTIYKLTYVGLEEPIKSSKEEIDKIINECNTKFNEEQQEVIEKNKKKKLQIEKDCDGPSLF